jgi:hypothetical protein
MLFQDQKVLFRCIDKDYLTNITLSTLARYFIYFEDLVNDYKDSNIDVTYFIFDCELTKQYVKYLIELIFNNTIEKNINYCKLLRFMVEYNIKNYNDYFKYINNVMDDTITFFNGCEIEMDNGKCVLLYDKVKLAYISKPTNISEYSICIFNYSIFDYKYYSLNMNSDNQKTFQDKIQKVFIDETISNVIINTKS